MGQQQDQGKKSKDTLKQIKIRTQQSKFYGTLGKQSKEGNP